MTDMLSARIQAVADEAETLGCWGFARDLIDIASDAEEFELAMLRDEGGDAEEAFYAHA